MKGASPIALACVLAVAAAAAAGEPLARVGIKKGQTPVQITGGIKQGADGTFTLPARGPWGWITVGEGGRPVKALEGLRSLTICGWARPTSLDTGKGGNRIAFNLNYNKAGLDLVQHSDGKLRLAVNEWPDQARNDSSPGKLRAGQWTFFAVAYDSTKRKDNVRWYFGGPKAPAALDRTNTYAAGPTGAGSGPLTVGNYNTTIHRHGTDRQFRGQLHGVQIFGSKTGADGALGLDAIRKLQTDPGAVPDFTAPAPKVVAPATPAPKGNPQPSDPALPGANTPVPPVGTRPRIIATTDGEIDDRCSMVRFLYYNNEWDIEGIIHSSSKFHWKGDGKKVKRKNWADEVWLDRQIDLYEKLYPNLAKHAKGFRTADQLRKLVYTGNVENVGEMTKVTPGSTRIVEVLLDDRPGPVYLQAWGGTNTIARALKTIQDKHPRDMRRVSRKAIIYIILDQDRTFRDYIAPNWPDLQVLGSFRQFAAVAYGWHKFIPPPHSRYYEKDWMKANILTGHGELCGRYEHNNGAFRSEGDTPAYWHQIDVGLRSLEHPGYGGWGGRFVRETGRGPSRNTWRGAKDDGDLYKPLWRWTAAIQNDWAARADWGITPNVKDANHPPTAKVAGPLDRTVTPGQKVTLSAEGSSDPDGDKLSFRWWRYDDVDTSTARIDIAGAATQSGASFVVPDEVGKTIHIILEVTDDGDPPLTRYQRVIFTIG